MPIRYYLILAALIIPAPAGAQSLLKSIKKRTEDATRQKVVNAGVNATGKAIDAATCTVADLACQKKAREEGRKVVIDSSATAAASPPAAPAATSSPSPAAAPADTGSRPALPKPGEGAWANYDFTPGERILFADDLSRDKVGDFPRRLEFVGGNMEIVEWNGARWLRAGGQGDFILPLPEVLPEKFTLEFDLAGFGNGMEIHFTDPVGHKGQNLNFSQTVGGVQRNGLVALGESGYNTGKTPVTARVMVDGRYVKVFVNETRVANVPNANLGRSNQIRFKLNGWDAKHPRMVGNFRVAAGGKTMYDAIAAEGRFATQGIYFDVGSDRIRPESTPTLKEIGSMLAQHPELKLVIEGHTDSTGSAEMNQRLSEMRATAVRAALLELYRFEAGRLDAVGYGAGKPAATNQTPEGRQTNRRVELLRN